MIELVDGCTWLPLLLWGRGSWRELPETTFPLCAHERHDGQFFSLSSPGGEGWGEEAVCPGVARRFMGRRSHRKITHISSRPPLAIFHLLSSIFYLPPL